MNFLKELKINAHNAGASTGQKWDRIRKTRPLAVHSPVDGKRIATVSTCTPGNLEKHIATAAAAAKYWRQVPPPERGEVIRKIGAVFRNRKSALGHLISYEMGKSLQEGLGEVQEVIDMCDLAVGQSRMLYGRVMASERRSHKMYETWHPMGVVAVLTAFNFPAAPWAWNAMIGSVCGNAILWKPSSQTPLTAIAIQKMIAPILKEEKLPEGLFSIVIGKGSDIGEAIIQDSRIPIVSFTGSTKTGRHVAEIVARRFGKSILELGGNNAVILAPDADLKLAVPAIVFGAVGTTGQRCTTIRRLIVHKSLFPKVKKSLIKAYQSLKIGNPLNETNHVGPMINPQAVELFREALATVKQQGGKVLTGGAVLNGRAFRSGCYVEPALVQADNGLSIVQQETFAPILYLIPYEGSVSNAVAIQNAVPQGLSSSIFTNTVQNMETFLSATGSDCGLANVNMGTSGAEIGGAFGGEKETGGGREAGSDAWKGYMRRQTVTINYGDQLPLAQGIRFEIE